MKLRYFPSTPAQRKAHAAAGGLYKLHGHVALGAHLCRLEDLRGAWSRPDPVWEVHAPDGYIFQPEGLHSLLGHTQSDLAERLEGATVEACQCIHAGCDEHWAFVVAQN